MGAPEPSIQMRIVSQSSVMTMWDPLRGGTSWKLSMALSMTSSVSQYASDAYLFQGFSGTLLQPMVHKHDLSLPAGARLSIH